MRTCCSPGSGPPFPGSAIPAVRLTLTLTLTLTLSLTLSLTLTLTLSLTPKPGPWEWRTPGMGGRYRSNYAPLERTVIRTCSVTNKQKQEAQLMLTTGSTRLALSRGQQTWYHFGSIATFR